jgi:hypothetical protein
MKKTLIPTLMIAAASQAFAAGGASWLSYPTSARNVAEAGGLGVMAEGTHSLRLNAAGLASLQGQGEVSLSHSSWAADIRAEHLGVALKAPMGVASFGGSWIDFGGIQGYRLGASGVEETGTLRPSAGTFEGAWAWALPGSGLKLGIGGGMLMQDLDGTRMSSAPTFEAGLRYDGPFALRVAASASNLGPELDGSPQPSQMRAGIAWGGGQGPVLAGIEVSNQGFLGVSPDLAAALRVRLAGPLSAHGGWQQLSGAAGSPSFGLSFNAAGRWDMDYAFREQSGFGPTHHLSLSLRWG